MENKLGIITGVFGVSGSVIAGLFGGWSEGLTVLCIFMLIDIITGIMCGIMCKSTKSKSGGLKSDIIFRGIIKKLVILSMVVVGAQLDRITGESYIRDAVVIAYIVNETISIIENAGLMGIPIPGIITKVIDVLKSKSKDE